MDQEIDIDIAENGDVKVSGKGIQGPDCVKLTAAIEAAVGTVTKQVKTAEYHRSRPALRKAGA